MSTWFDSPLCTDTYFIHAHGLGHGPLGHGPFGYTRQWHDAPLCVDTYFIGQEESFPGFGLGAFGEEPFGLPT